MIKTTTNDYVFVPYVANGRCMQGMDCWGLVRHAREHMFGRERLPAYDGISPDDKRSLTKAVGSCASDYKFKQVDPVEGAIACAYMGSICVHVGIIVNADDKLWVMETDEANGFSLTPLSAFESRFTRVTYHDN